MRPELGSSGHGLAPGVLFTYNSASSTESPFGYGWQMNYVFSYLEEDESGDVAIMRPDGHKNLFVRQTDGSEMLTETSADGKTVTVTETNSEGKDISTTTTTTVADGSTTSTEVRAGGETTVTETSADGHAKKVTVKNTEGEVESTAETTTVNNGIITATQVVTGGNTTVTTTSPDKTKTVITVTSADGKSVTHTVKDKDGNVVETSHSETLADDSSKETRVVDGQTRITTTSGDGNSATVTDGQGNVLESIKTEMDSSTGDTTETHVVTGDYTTVTTTS